MKIKEKYIAVKRGNTFSGLDTKEVYALIERVTNSAYSAAVLLEKAEDDGFDFYEVSDFKGKIRIRSGTGVGFASGFNAYLKERCGYSVGALSVSGTLPDVPPAVGEPIVRKSKFLYRNFFNYCTFSYTYAFDGWEEWEKTLDYLILSGYNLILNPVGTESVFRNTLLALGYGKREINDFLCGPAFYAWEWMMNMTGWAGGVPEWWYEERLALAGKINERLRAFGVSVMAPGYAGMVPADFRAHFPEAKLLEQGKWCGYERPAILLPEDPLFDKIADIFYAESKKIAGATHTHYYSVDPFHEGGKAEGVDLFSYSRRVFEKMTEVDRNAVWVFQGWGANPKEDMLKAIPEERALVTNLLSLTKSESGMYCGLPWCFDTVCCFGGQYNFEGDAQTILEKPHLCLSDENVNMVGIGYMPEGVNCVEFIYEIYAYNAFAEKGKLEEFIPYYLTTKYGKSDEKLILAFSDFCRDVLNGKQAVSGESALCARPSLTTENTSYWGKKPNPYMDQTPLLRFIKVMLGEYDTLKGSNAYRKDLMEATRQAISNLSWYFCDRIKKAYAEKDLTAVSRFGGELLSLFDLQSAVVSTDASLLLGTWLEKAKKNGKTPAEKTYFEWNARTQITLWASREGAVRLRDYSAREWQGLLEDFYRPRWESFISRLELSLLTDKPLEESNDYDGELPFTYQKKKYPTAPGGDLKKAVTEALEKIGSVSVSFAADEDAQFSFVDNVMKTVAE